jgi:hypothetical protein
MVSMQRLHDDSGISPFALPVTPIAYRLLIIRSCGRQWHVLTTQCLRLIALNHSARILCSIPLAIVGSRSVLDSLAPSSESIETGLKTGCDRHLQCVISGSASIEPCYVSEQIEATFRQSLILCCFGSNVGISDEIYTANAKNMALVSGWNSELAQVCLQSRPEFLTVP